MAQAWCAPSWPRRASWPARRPRCGGGPSPAATEASAPRPANLPLREDGAHGFRAGEPGLPCAAYVTEFAPGGLGAYLSPAIDCFDGRPVCRGASLHPDEGLAVGTLEGLVAAVRPTESRPLVVHADGCAAFGELGERLDAYVEWYRDARPKKALGWRTTAEYRRDLGYGHALAA